MSRDKLATNSSKSIVKFGRTFIRLNFSVEILYSLLSDGIYDSLKQLGMKWSQLNTTFYVTYLSQETTKIELLMLKYYFRP
jgi:hypothetical protein